MIQLELDAPAMQPQELRSWLTNSLAQMPADSIVKLRVNGMVSTETMEVLRAPSLRTLAPSTMNIEAVFPEFMRKYTRK
jgi:hypothetical protein